MKEKHNEQYEVPTTTVVELKFDGILCYSLNDTTNATLGGFTEETI